MASQFPTEGLVQQRFFQLVERGELKPVAGFEASSFFLNRLKMADNIVLLVQLRRTNNSAEVAVPAWSSPLHGFVMKDDEIDLDRVLYREDVRALVEKNMRAIRRLPTRYLSLYHGTKDEILNSLELKIDDCFDSQDEASLVLSCML